MYDLQDLENTFLIWISKNNYPLTNFIDILLGVHAWDPGAEAGEATPGPLLYHGRQAAEVGHYFEHLLLNALSKFKLPKYCAWP